MWIASRSTSCHSIALGAILLLLAGTAILLGAPQEKKPAADQAAAAALADNQPATYVGSETCQACHEDIFNDIEKSPHHVIGLDKKRGWDGKTCEACHGPGNKHAESASADDIRNPAKLDPGGSDRVCLTCHLNEPTHIGRIQSSHARNKVSCITCHSIHAHGPNGLVVRKASAVNEQCAGCHASEWAQFQRPYKHRLPEGGMSCVDCHNPHGSFLPGMKQVFGANEPGCFNCHGAMRGPFTFEHPPLRFEGCVACHEPHGSANPRMLTRQSVQYVCLECHANLPSQSTGPQTALGVVPPSFHDLRSPRYQNCTICHLKIHGSYVDRDLLR